MVASIEEQEPVALFDVETTEKNLKPTSAALVATARTSMMPSH